MPGVGLHENSQLSGVRNEGKSIEDLRIRMVKTKSEMIERRYMIRTDREQTVRCSSEVGSC